MRIIAGRFRGTHLTELGKGDDPAHLRPTTDRVRESLFNMLEGGRFGSPVVDARVLDLFAGTGALGLEALSRGAERVCFVENGKPAFRILSKNIAKLRAAEETTVLSKDATKLGPNPYKPFTLILLDPPYGKSLGQKALLEAKQNGWIGADALIVWEEASAQIAPPGFTQLDTRAYGGTHITLLEPA
ncbi:16S rRNA (guanine(966)-N(2))-methyltransferase RsmD [uncultured Litoreibacter sp.]|uniref:16S rRNA (guanine(966)-N(2))-methyltransferase RsmD n=1 Tax=uncultured Litoreibacter sp. TaxID=1392394 RepID=UPI00261CF5F6|nr:16S rRNA (guanine(966)-N(2))-methyltransferase RsmD [uncultured Litoreibacter sp.]